MSMSAASGWKYPHTLTLLSIGWVLAGWVGASLAPWMALREVPEAVHWVLPAVTAALILCNLGYALWGLRAGVPIGRLFLVTGLQVGLFTTLFYQLAAHRGAEHYDIKDPVSTWEWFLFSFAHALRASDVLDLIAAYNVPVQTVKHQGWLSATVVVTYNLIIDVFMLGVLWAAVEQFRRWLFNRVPANVVRYGIAALLVLWLLTWLICALKYRPWQPIDLPLWLVENVFRVIDFPDLMNSYHIRLHDVPHGWREDTLTFLCCVWIALGISYLMRRRDSDLAEARPASPADAWVGLGKSLVVVAGLFVLIFSVDRAWKATSQDTLPDLADAAGDSDAVRAGHALRALRRLGPAAAEAISDLAKAREQLAGERRSAITHTLPYLGDKAIPVLTAIALRDEGPEAVNAVEAFKPIGPNAAPALVQVWKEGGTAAARAEAEARLFEPGSEAVDPLMAATDIFNSAEHYEWFVRLDEYWTSRSPSNPTAIAVQHFHRLTRRPSHSGYDSESMRLIIPAGSVALAQLTSSTVSVRSAV
jgi:hypothetical protein